VTSTGGPPGPAVSAPPLGSVVEIDPVTGAATTTVADIGLSPLGTLGGRAFTPPIAVGEAGVWVMDSGDVKHLDPGTGEVVAISFVAHGFAGIVPEVVVGLGDVVITDAIQTGGLLTGALSRIDPATLRIRTIDYPSTGLPSGLAIGAGSIWETFTGGIVLRIDPRTFRVEHRFDIQGSADSVAADDRNVWVADSLASSIRRIDAETGATFEPIALNGGVDGLATDAGRVWVLDRGAGTVTPVDPVSGVGRPIRVGEDPTDIVAGLGAIWVTDGEGMLWRVDPVTGERTSIDVGSPLASVAIDRQHETLWILVAKH
jgi:streptogramin lyase